MRRKIFTRSQLREHLDHLRRESGGMRFVFTNGCFDLLHVGHLRYLWEARGLGDALVVAINDDASVRRLKGSERPILKLEERLQVLAGLACVDFVTWFGEDTPIPLLRELKPEVLCKGATYDVQGVVGHDVVSEWNAEVTVLRLTEERSTTGLIEKVMGNRHA